MKYLLDTNICIYIIREKPSSVLNKFSKVNVGEVYISSITLAELEYGVKKSKFPKKNQIALLDFLTPIQILPFDQRGAIEYGTIRANLEKIGNIIGSYDLLIAAHAKSENLILVTNNVREFNRISGLQIENWAE